MAVDKLVDSTQLDADLTSVADAIRTKGGTSAQLAFPADFVSAINAISGGGGGLEHVAQYTTTADAKTTGTGGNTLDFWNSYMQPNVGTSEKVVLFAIVTNNTATGGYARVCFLLKSPDLVGSMKLVRTYFRSDSQYNVANSTASNYDFFTSAGSVIDVYRFEGDLPV